jgi:putative transposase
MSKIFHPLLYLLACATRQEFARQIQFLKTENEILRARLPKKIMVTPEERRRLVKAGRKLGSAIKGVISTVTPATFMRWLNAEENKPQAEKAECKPSRPRTPDDIRDLVVKLVTETGWGDIRILSELKKLGVGKITRQYVKNIL